MGVHQKLQGGEAFLHHRDKLEMYGMVGIHWVCKGVWCSFKKREGGEQMLSVHESE